MLWNGYRGLMLLTAAARCGADLAGDPALQAIRSRRQHLASAHVLLRVADRPPRAVRHDPFQLSASAGQPGHVRVLRRRDGQQPGCQLGVFGAVRRVRPEERNADRARCTATCRAQKWCSGCAPEWVCRPPISPPMSCRRCIGRSRPCAARSRSTWSSCWRRASAPGFVKQLGGLPITPNHRSTGRARHLVRSAVCDRHAFGARHRSGRRRVFRRHRR